MRRNLALPLVFSLFLVLISAYGNQLQAQPIKATVITVSDVGDAVDASPGDGICANAAGKCTLRAAIAESNATAGTDAIIFDVPVPAVITLTLGELKITSPVGIFGRGARNLTIQRRNNNDTSNFRVFNITSFTQMRGLTIKNGNSSTSGGGILAAAGVRLYDVAITGNRANAGGGIAFQASEESHSVLERCLINSNTAFGQGGGMYVAAGMGPIIMSSTLTNNSALEGGAISNYGYIALANDTITQNSASQGSSSMLSGSGGNVEIVNTIIGRDIGQTVPALDGQFQSDGSNIITNTTGSSGWRSSDQVSTNNAIDPMLGNLTDNGGQTDSFALLPGSSAIDRGDNCVFMGGCGPYTFFDLDYDQRKFRRVAGNTFRVDVGGYEAVSGPNLSIWTRNFLSGGTPGLAYSRVTVTNTETMERRFSFIISEGSQPMSFEWNGVYLSEIRSKRGIFNPLLCTFGGCDSF